MKRRVSLFVSPPCHQRSKIDNNVAPDTDPRRVFNELDANLCIFHRLTEKMLQIRNFFRLTRPISVLQVAQV